MNIKRTLKLKDAMRNPIDALEQAYETGARNMVDAIYNYVIKEGEVVIPHYAHLYFDEQAAENAPGNKAGYVTVEYIGSGGTHWLNEHTPSEIYKLAQRILEY